MNVFYLLFVNLSKQPIKFKSFKFSRSNNNRPYSKIVTDVFFRNIQKRKEHSMKSVLIIWPNWKVIALFKQTTVSHVTEIFHVPKFTTTNLTVKTIETSETNSSLLLPILKPVSPSTLKQSSVLPAQKSWLNLNLTSCDAIIKINKFQSWQQRWTKHDVNTVLIHFLDLLEEFGLKVDSKIVTMPRNVV